MQYQGFVRNRKIKNGEAQVSERGEREGVWGGGSELCLKYFA